LLRTAVLPLILLSYLKRKLLPQAIIEIFPTRKKKPESK